MSGQVLCPESCAPSLGQYTQTQMSTVALSYSSISDNSYTHWSPLLLLLLQLLVRTYMEYTASYIPQSLVPLVDVASNVSKLSTAPRESLWA